MRLAQHEYIQLVILVTVRCADCCSLNTLYLQEAFWALLLPASVRPEYVHSALQQFSSVSMFGLCCCLRTMLAAAAAVSF